MGPIADTDLITAMGIAAMHPIAAGTIAVTGTIGSTPIAHTMGDTHIMTITHTMAVIRIMAGTAAIHITAAALARRSSVSDLGLAATTIMGIDTITTGDRLGHSTRRIVA